MIVDKDVYRLMKVETLIEKDLRIKRAKSLGKCVPEPLINLKSAKYKDPTTIIR
jgi:hypothetical protein